jgi:hypothetical protein
MISSQILSCLGIMDGQKGWGEKEEKKQGCDFMKKVREWN